jgi:hypothetical protein
MKEKNFKKYCEYVIKEFEEKVEDEDYHNDNLKLKYIVKLMDEYEPEIDYSKKDGWESCSGSKTDDYLRTHTLFMCGGCPEWYNYIIDISGNVFKESAKGREYLKDAVVYTNQESGYVLIDDDSYEVNMRDAEENLSEIVMCSMFPKIEN